MNFAMPQEVPPCGRYGCKLQDKHSHRDWEAGDRVVVEPKLATAPGWAYANPRGTVVAGPHLSGMSEVVTVPVPGVWRWSPGLLRYVTFSSTLPTRRLIVGFGFGRLYESSKRT